MVRALIVTNCLLQGSRLFDAPVGISNALMCRTQT